MTFTTCNPSGRAVKPTAHLYLWVGANLLDGHRAIAAEPAMLGSYFPVRLTNRHGGIGCCSCVREDCRHPSALELEPRDGLTGTYQMDASRGCGSTVVSQPVLPGLGEPSEGS
jgi:hypothetical protein